MVTSIARLAIYYAVMVAPVYAYNPMKIPQTWHQSDWKLMIFHSVYDSDGLFGENEKGPKCAPHSLRKYHCHNFRNFRHFLF